MSLQDRRCSECKHEEIDRLESIHSNDVIECPVCKKMTFIKKLVQSSFRISGYSESNGYSNG